MEVTERVTLLPMLLRLRCSDGDACALSMVSIGSISGALSVSITWEFC